MECLNRKPKRTVSNTTKPLLFTLLSTILCTSYRLSTVSVCVITGSNIFYYINTDEILGELSRENMISSHVKITCYFHMWKYHRCCRYIINRAFRRKNCFIEMVWYFIGVYVKNGTLHGRLEIRNFSSRVENISLIRCAHSWNIFQQSKRNFVSPRGHVISSI